MYNPKQNENFPGFFKMYDKYVQMDVLTHTPKLHNVLIVRTKAP